jgi:hypothetical protein
MDRTSKDDGERGDTTPMAESEDGDEAGDVGEIGDATGDEMGARPACRSPRVENAKHLMVIRSFMKNRVASANSVSQQ